MNGRLDGRRVHAASQPVLNFDAGEIGGRLGVLLSPQHDLVASHSLALLTQNADHIESRAPTQGEKREFNRLRPAVPLGIIDNQGVACARLRHKLPAVSFHSG